MKRKLLNIIILGMLIVLTACGGSKGLEEENISYSDEIDEEKETEKKEAEEDDDREEEKEEDSTEKKRNKVTSLQLQLGKQYFEEWMENDSEIYGYTTLCNGSWQNLVLADESAERYPELAEKLHERNVELNNHYQEIKADLRTSAEEIYEFQKEYFYPLSSNNSYSVQRADNYILSIREDADEYWGGAHPMYGAYGINYDVNTGEILKITDVLTSIEKLPAILSEKVIQQYADEYETFELLEETLESYSAEDYNWTMGYQGITFYFPPYEIASYAMGLIEINLWFDEMPELFEKKYRKVPENGYCMALPLDYGVEIDLDNQDGKKNRLLVSDYYETEEEIEYGISRLSIMYDDYSYFETECYGYEIKPYLVCVGDSGREKYYLYAETVAENDYKTISVYDLNDGEITLSGRVSGTGFASYWEENEGEYGIYYDYVFNNPQEFQLGTRMDILGTWNGIRTYVVNEDTGLPEATKEYYVLPDNSPSMKSVIPLEVMMLPWGKKEELPAGTDFYPIRTDGETYVDMRLDNGKECRIYVEYEGWDMKINGIDQWECFETLWYAG